MKIKEVILVDDNTNMDPVMDPATQDPAALPADGGMAPAAPMPEGGEAEAEEGGMDTGDADNAGM